MQSVAKGLGRLRAAAYLLGAACLLVPAVGCSADDDAVVARSDGLSLRASDVKTLLDGLEPASREKARANPQLVAGLLKQDMQRRLLLQQAQARNWEQRPEVKAAIERARREIVVESYLQSVAAPPDSFPSEVELQQAYKLNQDRLLQPRQYHVAQIYLALPPGTAPDSAAARAVQDKAARLAATLRSAPQGFGDTARKESDDKDSAARGGDLGWTAEPQLAPEIKPVVAGLAAGQVSDPVFASGGWHILRLVETRPGSVAPYDQVKDELRTLLRRQQAQKDAAAYTTRLLLDQHAAVDEIRLQQVLGAGNK